MERYDLEGDEKRGKRKRILGTPAGVVSVPPRGASRGVRSGGHGAKKNVPRANRRFARRIRVYV
jgi:hypothetical protein